LAVASRRVSFGSNAAEVWRNKENLRLCYLAAEYCDKRLRAAILLPFAYGL
jgi:hypothetical protein